VSVIIPVKNAERYLAEAIDSVLEQDYPSYEILAVDGQSIDNTEKIAKSYDCVSYIYQDTNPGLAYARNVGIDSSRGEYIAFLAADDLWTPDKLSTQVGYMIRHPNVQHTITRVKFFLEPGSSIPPGFKPQLLNGDYVGPMPEALVARKSLFRTLGNFRPEFGIVEDVDWFARAKDARVPMAIIDKVLLHKRVHSSNLAYRPQEALNIRVGLARVLKESIDRQRNRDAESNHKT